MQWYLKTVAHLCKERVSSRRSTPTSFKPRVMGKRWNEIKAERTDEGFLINITMASEGDNHISHYSADGGGSSGTSPAPLHRQQITSEPCAPSSVLKPSHLGQVIMFATTTIAPRSTVRPRIYQVAHRL